jgi:hypothetical protein
MYLRKERGCVNMVYKNQNEICLYDKRERLREYGV